MSDDEQFDWEQMEKACVKSDQKRAAFHRLNTRFKELEPQRSKPSQEQAIHPPDEKERNLWADYHKVTEEFLDAINSVTPHMRELGLKAEALEKRLFSPPYPSETEFLRLRAEELRLGEERHEAVEALLKKHCQPMS